MINCIVLLSLAALPINAMAYNLRIDVDINIMTGDGTQNAGDKNTSSEERTDSDTIRE